jgi:hypothetical protein
MIGRTPLIRGLIWLSLAAFIALFWTAFVSPILEWRTETRGNLTASQEKATRLLSSIKMLEKERLALSSGTDFQDIWRADSVSEATAQVQAALGGIAREQGVSFRSIAPLPSPIMPLTSAVAFRLEAEFTLDRLVEFLKTVEYSEPLILIERANIRRLARGATGTEQPTVFVQLDVTAPVLLPEDET